MAVMAQTRHAEGTASPRQQRQALSAKRRKQERERRELKRFIEAKHEQHGYYAKMKMCKAAGVEWQYGECGPRDSPKNDKRVMTRSVDVGLKAMKKNSPRAEESKLEAPHSRRPLVARLAEMSVLAARNSPKLVRRGSSNPDLVESEARNFLKASSLRGYVTSRSPKMVEIGLPEVPLCSSSSACGLFTLQGSAHANQDCAGASIVPEKQLATFAMLDGHGHEGELVSAACQRNLFAGIWADVLRGDLASDAMNDAFALTAEVVKKSTQFDSRFSGCAAIVAAITVHQGARLLTVGSVGDSRCVLGRARQADGDGATVTLEAVALTHDHKPSDPAERKRLAACNAIVKPSRVHFRANGTPERTGVERLWDDNEIYGVAMSRSLGDTQVHPYLIAVPDIAVVELDARDRLLVLATDGVWDTMDNDEAVKIASSHPPDAAAKEIVHICKTRWEAASGRRDDITCTVVDLTHKDVRFDVAQPPKPATQHSAGFAAAKGFIRAYSPKL